MKSTMGACEDGNGDGDGDGFGFGFDDDNDNDNNAMTENDNADHAKNAIPPITEPASPQTLNKTDNNLPQTSLLEKKKEKKCWICAFFSYSHPSEICQWSRGYERSTTPLVYNPPVPEFHFCLDDMEKMRNEDPEITKKFNKEDKSQSDYSTTSSMSTTSTLQSGMSYVSESGKK
jgi:hypothetical protein